MNELAYHIGMAVIGIAGMVFFTALGMLLKSLWVETTADLSYRWKQWRGKK